MEHALNGVDLISLLLFGGSRLTQDEKNELLEVYLESTNVREDSENE